MTLKDDVNDMWLASVGMPAITNMRILARQGKISKEDAEKIMQIPLQTQELFAIILKNREVLIQEFAHDFGVPFHVETIQHYTDSRQKAAADATTAESLSVESPSSSTPQASMSMAAAAVQVFDDEQNASELVFGMAVNHDKKRIIVAFRGSVTANDYKADFKVFMETIRHPSKPEVRLAVHSGIYQYLHRKRKDGTSKWDVIQVYLKDLMDSNPGYELYLTGHSLGASLAILLAFRLLTEGDALFSKTPISVLAFGPMLVGDLRFRRAFQKLEMEGKLRCLCVVNEGDFIPLIPERGRPFTSYRRVGVYLRLSPTGEIAFSYASRTRTFVRAWWRDIPNQVNHRLRLLHTLMCVSNFSANHDVHHYTTYIVDCGENMKKVDWELFEKGREAGGFIRDVW